MSNPPSQKFALRRPPRTRKADHGAKAPTYLVQPTYLEAPTYLVELTRFGARVRVASPDSEGAPPRAIPQ